jgi:Fe-S-cluster containining protein
MELSEAEALSNTFITEIAIRVNFVPNSPASGEAALWASTLAANISVADKIAESHRHFEALSSGKKLTGDGAATAYIKISATSLQRAGPCTSLVGSSCGIYDSRPATCRTVPFGYDKPEILLKGAFDEFINTGRDCQILGHK